MPKIVTSYFKNKTVEWRGSLVVSRYNWVESTCGLLIKKLMVDSWSLVHCT
jgi:hypothetical protein